LSGGNILDSEHSDHAQTLFPVLPCWIQIQENIQQYFKNISNPMFLYLEGPCLASAREIVRMQCGIKAPCANHADDGDLILTGSEAIQLWPSNGRVKTVCESG